MLESVHSWFASIVYVTQRSSRAAGSVLSPSCISNIVGFNRIELLVFEKHEDPSVGVGGVDTR